MDTANGVKLGSNWESLYFICYCADLDLKFKGSQANRVRQFEDYITPIIMPFAKDYGLNDYYDPSEEDLRAYLPYLEADFKGCDTLSEWCERRGYKALCYWDLEEETGDNHVQCPVWLR